MLLDALYHCWLSLFRKANWNDVHHVSERIIELRELQTSFESIYLNGTDSSALAKALSLVSLYHWAKSTEIVATFVLQGHPRKIREQIGQQFDSARKAANALNDFELDILLRWLQIASSKMITNSVWSVSHAPNSKIERFLNRVTKARGLFELLPPQQAAIQKQGLLDPATRAIVVDLPTSAGKTVLAQFRILQALNQFQDGWVAYVAPTRALVSQITRRLRSDFQPLSIFVQQLTGAVVLDEFEEKLLTQSEASKSFQVLVCTPEKLQMVIRNKLVKRTLALVVLDEAHNLEDIDRGMRIELLLATIKRECEDANFMLLTPFVPNSAELAEWLEPESGKSISLSSSAWQPNERIVGMYRKVAGTSKGQWSIDFEVLETGYKSFELKDTVFRIPGPKPLNVSYSGATKTSLTAAMSKYFSRRGTSIGIARTIPDCWEMARKLAAEMPSLSVIPPEIKLVQRFLQTEISSSFELIPMLAQGIAVHHSGLSEEARTLIEWLAEQNLLTVLCATTTIAQGINFPVASVFLASKSVPGYSSRDMSERTFWNLAGRAGRLDQGALGIIGIAADEEDIDDIRKYVIKQTGALRSRFVQLLTSIDETGQLHNLEKIIQGAEWDDFRAFVSHIVNDAQDKSKVTLEADLLLRHTFGYSELKRSANQYDRQRAEALLQVTRKYAGGVRMNEAALVDSTGFSAEAIRDVMRHMANLDRKLTIEDWTPENLFGPSEKSALSSLVSVMLQVPQLRNLQDSFGNQRSKIDVVASDWVSGQSIETIAKKHFSKDNSVTTDAITLACQGIYRSIGNFGTWGISALSKIPNSGIDFKKLSPQQISTINQLPAMLYHGVKTSEAVLMRMNSVPRSIAENLGQQYQSETNGEMNSKTVHDFISSLPSEKWGSARPLNATMSGDDYREIWKQLAGET
ncbi:MAG: DEAD/DEAH box helicase [Cyanobacteria bacterium SZAS-4]|nr:DEAD/DEAH box helicase [Cyanobacteria bacterium SZAS-4]